MIYTDEKFQVNKMKNVDWMINGRPTTAEHSLDKNDQEIGFIALTNQWKQANYLGNQRQTN
jgi:hypothetical protein